MSHLAIFGHVSSSSSSGSIRRGRRRRGYSDAIEKRTSAQRESHRPVSFSYQSNHHYFDTDNGGLVNKWTNFWKPNISHPRLRRLKKQIEGQNRGREEVKLKIEEIEEKVLRRERYLKVDKWTLVMTTIVKIMIIIADAQEMREEAFRRVGSDSATIEGQITAAERWATTFKLK